MAMARYRALLLGTPGIYCEGTSVTPVGGKPLALLAYLLLEPEPASRERLAALLWPRAERERGLQSVRQALWQIRRTIGPVLLDSDDPAIDGSAISCDVLELRAALARDDVAAALELWRGELLCGFSLSGTPLYEDWLERRRTELTMAYTRLLQRHARTLVQQGDVAAATRLLERAIAADPYSPGHRLALLDLLLDTGQQRAAALALGAARTALSEPEYAAELETRERRLQHAEPAPRSQMIGRAHELGVLLGAWLAARGGETQRVLLAGAGGVGKSRVVDELGAVVQRDGGRVVRVRAAESDRALPWSAVVSLARALLVLPGAAGASAASDMLLRRIVPGLSRHGESLEPLSSFPEPVVLAEALADMLAAVAWEAPVVVAVDDARFIDVRSWTVLQRVALQLRQDPVLFVFAGRAAREDTGVHNWLQRVRDALQPTIVLLAPLSVEEVAEFVAINGGLPVSVAGGWAPMVHGLTRGLPLYLCELLEYLRRRGLLVQRPDGWQWQGPDDIGQVLPAEPSELLSVRIAALPPAAERVLAEAAEGERDPRALGDASGLAPDEADRILGILTDEGLLLADADGYRFAHDQIASVVRARVHEKQRRTRKRPRWPIVVGIVLALVTLVLLVLRTPPPYGDGRIIVRDTAARYYEVLPPRWTWSDWRSKPLPDFADSLNLSPAVAGAVGEIVWLGTTEQTHGSPHAVLRERDGTIRTLARPRTDASAVDVSPFGDRVLLHVDDPATRHYDLGLLMAGRDGSQPRVLYQTQFTLKDSHWAPDGLVIETSVPGLVDTLVLMTPSGRILWRKPVNTLHRFSWCGSSNRAAVAIRDGELKLYRMETALRALLPVPGVKLAGDALACSPDGRRVFAQAVLDQRLEHVVVDIVTGETERITKPMPQSNNAWWYLPRARRVPVRVRLTVPARMAVGETVTPEARVFWSDGHASTARVSVTTSTPRVLAPGQPGSFTAARAGDGRLIASYRDLLFDSLTVQVASDAPARLVLADGFTDLDQSWQVFGAPAPRVVTHERHQDLLLTGDNNFADGVVSTARVNLRRGFAAEIRLSTPLTQPDAQYLEAGICRPRLSPTAAGNLMLEGTTGVNLLYPAERGPRFRRDRMSLWGFGAGYLFAVDPKLGDGREWVLRLELQPSGTSAAYIDGRLVAEGLVRAPRTAEPWQLCIGGASVGTEIRVHGVKIWEGVPW